MTTLLENLQNPDLFTHPVERFDVIETHISWVLLTGPRAYKIKKPVTLDFVDLSTLEKRHHYCQEEIRLNRRLAEDFYLGIESITGSPENPRLESNGTAFEYAVQMVEFPQEKLLSNVLAAGDLEPVHIDRLSNEIVEFHRSVEVANSTTDHATPKAIRERMNENFQALLEIDQAPVKKTLDHLHEWVKSENQKLSTQFNTRRKNGFVRECHGDMHLENIFLWDDEPVIFDCIEFNPEFRWIDVMDEIAFLTMDFHERDHSQFAMRVLNRYLSATGDYNALDLYRYYQVYRALVRAKVSYIQSNQLENTERASELYEKTKTYIDLARSFVEKPNTVLFLTHGFSGSGKTTWTQKFLERTEAVRVRSDVERKRLAGIEPEGSPSQSEQNQLYTEKMTRKTYKTLVENAEHILNAGFPAIMDATFLNKRWRDKCYQLAKRMEVPCRILHFEADTELLRDRLETRDRDQSISDADKSVLESQLDIHDPLTTAENTRTWTIDASTTIDESLPRIIEKFNSLKAPQNPETGYD